MDAFEAHASFGTRHGIHEKIRDIVNDDNSTTVKSLSLVLQVENTLNEERQKERLWSNFHDGA